MKYWFQNLIGWFETMYAYSTLLWEDRDWDFCFILGMLRFKLSRVEKYFREDGICTDHKIQADEVKEAIKLLDEMILDDFCGKEHDAHTKRWGRLKMTKDRGMEHTKVKTASDRNKQRKEFLKIMNLENRRRLDTWQKLFSHLNKHMMKWWD